MTGPTKMFHPLPDVFPGIENFPPKAIPVDRKQKSARKRKLNDQVELEVVNETKKARKPFSIVNRVSKAIDAPALKRSFSLRDRNKVVILPPKLSAHHTPQRTRRSILDRNVLIANNWIETVTEPYSWYSKKEIKLQEAIYTLYRTEVEYVQDLEMMVTAYAHPMLELEIVNQEEYGTIFKNIEELVSIHSNLVLRLQQVKSIDGTFGEVATPFLDWVPMMHHIYLRYCPNLVFAKELVEVKKSKPAFCEYLQKGRENELMRKIDFWTFLDSPRSRLMKYPILLKEIARLTESRDPILDSVISQFEELIRLIDQHTGFAKCDLMKRSLQFVADSQLIPEIDQSKTLLFMGEMKNRHNSRLTVFLFDKAFLIARGSFTKHGTLHQVYRQPIALDDLEFESIPESDFKTGSFRRRTMTNLVRNQIRFSSKAKIINSVTLQCQSDFDKKAWMDALHSAV